MANEHFISYSSADGQEFAFRLHDALEADGIPAWLDKRDIPAGRDWDLMIRDGVRDCATMLFVITPDSVSDTSVCHAEWSLALKYKKPVIPLRLDAVAEAPFRLQDRQPIDFTGDFATGIARLRKHFEWLGSPKGQLQQLKDRLKEAERDLRRASSDAERARIEADMETLREDITRLQKLVDDPAGTAIAAEASIEARLAVERKPDRAPKSTTRFINPLPMTAPAYFQDRYEQTKQIADFLRDESLRLLTFVGTGGVGKTAIVCRVLKALEHGQLPDDLGTLAVDGIVCLSTDKGSYRISVPTLFEGLSKLVPADTAAKLDAVYKDARLSTADKVRDLLAQFPTGRIVVLLDNAENLIDVETLAFRDGEMDDALRALLDAPHHALKVILTTRLKPTELVLVCPERQRLYELDKGLESPYAENILCEMDHTGMLGLRDAPDAQLGEARTLTRGFPRALEAAVAILRSDRNTSFEALLVDLHRWQVQQPAESTPDGVSHVVQKLVGEAFNRLDGTARQVMQALAIYNRPVPAVAVDYLLQPLQPGLDSTPVLRRLVNMHFVLHDAGRYYLHPVDNAYSMSLVPVDAPPSLTNARQPAVHSHTKKSPRRLFMKILRGADKAKEAEAHPPFSQMALTRCAAAYFRSVRTPRETWKTLRDLDAQLAEIDLRCVAGDYNTAANILTDIDCDYLLLWGHYRLMISLHERLQDRILDRKLKSISLASLGLAYSALGDVPRAIDFYQRALAIAREIGDRQGEGNHLGNLGNAYSALGDVPRAIDFYQQALAIAREIGDRQGEGNHLGNLGNAYSDSGDVPRAIEFYQQALAIAREIGDRQGEGNHLGNLGNASYSLGDVPRAIDFYQQALAIAREIGDRRGEGNHLGNLGSAYSALGDVPRAIEFYQQALQIDREIGDRRGEGNHLGNLGNAYYSLGDVPCAIDFYQQALAIAREIGDRQGEDNRLGNLGSAYSALGDVPRAIDFYQQALAIAREIGDRRGESNHLGNLGSAYGDLGDVPRAIEFYQQALQIDREIGDRRGERVWLGNLGSCYEQLERTDQALEHYEQALIIAREIDYPSGASINLTNIASIYLALGNHALAIQRCHEALDIANKIGFVQTQSEGRTTLAQAHLFAGDLTNARATINAARQYEHTSNTHNVLALQGIIALRQGDRVAAQEAFGAAITQANNLLALTSGYYAALDAKALALCGLALCEGDQHLPAAVEAFRAARQIIAAPGVVGDVLRLFDALAVVDAGGLLAPVREVISGV